MAMKKCVWILVVGLGLSLSVRSQQAEAEQLLLNVEKLAQFREILQQMKDGYTILVQGYNTIRDLSEGNFRLHQVFLDGLLQVSPTVRKYHRIAQILSLQLELSRQYQGAIGAFRGSALFSAGELDYLQGVYENVFAGSLRHLEDLATVITAGQLRMSDDERLRTIDRIYADMQERLVFLRVFNEENKVLLFQKAREQREVHVMRNLIK